VKDPRERNKPLLLALGFWAGGALLFWLAVHLPFSAPVERLEADSPAKLRSRYAQPGQPIAPAVPFDQALKAAEAERAALDQALEDARSAAEFVPRQEFILPAGTPQRPYEYTKIRDRVAAQLRELANQASVHIPRELDPRPDAKDLPREADTGELLLRLAITDRVVRNAVAAGVANLAAISHDLAPPHGSPIAQRTVKVKLEAELDPLIHFIEKCSQPPDGAPSGGAGALIVRSAEITAAHGASLSATIDLAALQLTEIKAAAPQRPPQAVARPSY